MSQAVFPRTRAYVIGIGLPPAAVRDRVTRTALALSAADPDKVEYDRLIGSQVTNAMSVAGLSTTAWPSHLLDAATAIAAAVAAAAPPLGSAWHAARPAAAATVSSSALASHTRPAS